ncbi:MAG: ABC transporter ATP-binding protein [Alphaproteobacteria bacterium]
MPETEDKYPLLEVEDLRVVFPTRKGLVEAVRGISFNLGREKLGIVGESGSGKSQTGRAILRLTQPPGKVTAKKLKFRDIDLLGAHERELRAIRGRRIAMVLQDPKFSLNPVMRVGDQITEACRLHEALSYAQAKDKALTMLESVRIRDPLRVFDAYPHEVSGGMGQRIMIAMMLAPDPDLLIADEPTSALDVTVQLQVLAILDDLVTRRGMGLIFISHDLRLVSSFCDRVLIMYGGKVMEECQASRLSEAQHPYTQGLLSCLPRIDDRHETLPTLQRDPAWLA